MALTQTSLTVACDMSVSLAVFAGNSDSEASHDIFGRARAPEFGSFL